MIGFKGGVFQVVGRAHVWYRANESDRCRFARIYCNRKRFRLNEKGSSRIVCEKDLVAYSVKTCVRGICRQLHLEAKRVHIEDGAVNWRAVCKVEKDNRVRTTVLSSNF